MAGTMPHAVFVEIDWDGAGSAAAYAAELPGCAAFAESPDAAVAAIPGRVADFAAWLTRHGERLPSFAGGNWYEVERASAARADGQIRRAAFSLDDLPPSNEEFTRYVHWLELAREELAETLDRTDPETAGPFLEPLEAQDRSFTAELGGDPPAASGDALDRLFAARDALMECLETVGPGAAPVRRIIRIAIADDLRVASALAGDGDGGGT